jgi:hypothetical protein
MWKLRGSSPVCCLTCCGHPVSSVSTCVHSALPRCMSSCRGWLWRRATPGLFSMSPTGNPLFVREGPGDGRRMWDPDRPPRTVLDVVRARLDSVSAGCRNFVQTAAIVGRDLSVALVATALDEPAAWCLPLTDEAIAYGLLDRVGDHGGYRFAALTGTRWRVARHCRPGGPAPRRRRGDPDAVRRPVTCPSIWGSHPAHRGVARPEGGVSGTGLSGRRLDPFLLAVVERWRGTHQTAGQGITQ